MVVGTSNFDPSSFRHNYRIRRRLSSCTIYIYVILKNGRMKARREKMLETILVLILACVVFSWLLQNNLFLIAAFIIGLIGLFIPALGNKIHWFWNKLSHVLGTIMNSVLLLTIYIVVLLPLAFLSRIFAKTSIRLKAGGKSYFHDRDFRYTKESMEKMW